MTWGQEILRALLLAFGTAEIICNTTYLIKKDGLNSARKQHGELPENISDKKIKVKVICMLTSGILFFVVSLSSYILHRYIHNAVLIASLLFCFYGIIEALYYKYWKTFGFAFVSILIAAASIFI